MHANLKHQKLNKAVQNWATKMYKNKTQEKAMQIYKQKLFFLQQD